jgi:hypothetical protein
MAAGAGAAASTAAVGAAGPWTAACCANDVAGKAAAEAAARISKRLNIIDPGKLSPPPYRQGAVGAMNG